MEQSIIQIDGYLKGQDKGRLRHNKEKGDMNLGRTKGEDLDIKWTLWITQFLMEVENVLLA